VSVLNWHTAWGAVAQSAVHQAVANVAELPAGPILDLGCGLGVAWEALATMRRPVVAVEANEEVAAAARDRADRLGVRLICAGVTDWIAPHRETFALVWAGDVFWSNYFASPAAAVAHVAASVRPGGRIAAFTANWFGSRFLWGHPDLERRVQQASARRWAVAGDGNFDLHERVGQWLHAAGGRDLTCAMTPLVGCAGQPAWTAWRRYLEVGVWPDYLAAVKTHGSTEDREALEGLTTPGHPGYLPDLPGYVAYQPALVFAARW
jgi:SAM-dependent methyltransferase